MDIKRIQRNIMNKFKLINYTTEMKMDKFLEWHQLLTVHRVLKGTKYKLIQEEKMNTPTSIRETD